MMNCKSCKHYSDWDFMSHEQESWCNRKNCFIARPNEYSCSGFEDRFFTRLWKILSSYIPGGKKV